MLFSWLYWNPSKEIFYIPFLRLPLMWYSLFFAIGFVLGYYTFKAILKRYFLSCWTLDSKDIVDQNLFLDLLKNPQNIIQKKVGHAFLAFLEPEEKELILAGSENDKYLLVPALNRFVKTDKVEAFFDKKKSSLFQVGAQKKEFFENVFSNCFYTSQKKSIFITDKVLVYMVLATVIGARLGHLLFYESPSFYLFHPLEIFKVWQGGLASHGAALFIILALFLLSYRLRKFSPKISWLVLLDFVVAPTALAGMFIRIGNFFNQEVLGCPSEKPWAVIFGSPSDGGIVVPRHPAQLYEAIFYFAVFVLLWNLTKRTYFLLRRGKTIGLFLILVFGFRFIVEFWKVEQSALLTDPKNLLMGQYLSLPFIILGICFFLWDTIRSKLSKSLVFP